MSSLTRSLPYCHQWRVLAASSAGGNFVATNKEQLLHQANSSGPSFPIVEHFRLLDVTMKLVRDFHTTNRICVEHKVETALQDCFSLLGVEEDCTDQDLKKAYLEKAKAYHPDSGASSADPYKFSQVKDAYKAVLEYRKGRELQEEEIKEAEIIFDIKHTAPQHRQYLEFEGVGFGSPSQRQRQYQQHRVARVTENIFQHRVQRLASETEDSLVVKDKQQAKKAIISNAIERIVEDLIQESMKRGDFNNLPGQGQPLVHSAHNPFVDITTHNLNKIMVNNGYAPEWIMLQSEIRNEIQQARQALALVDNRLEKPFSTKGAKTWRETVERFRHEINEINTKINKFNLIVPFLDKQKMPYNPEKEANKVLANVEQYLPENSDEAYLVWNISLPQTESSLSSSADKPIDWKQVWHDIKCVFKLSQGRA